MMDSEYKYKVCTRCYTYNHSAYIKETLDGFARQQTTFPVVFCVVDDASPDGEPEVIRDWCENNLLLNCEEAYKKQMPYGELIFAPCKINMRAFFAILLLDENHNNKKNEKRSYLKEWEGNSEYWAVCEGDDYWVVDDKLQSQVAFLDANPDYVLCYTDFDLSNGAPRNHTAVSYTDDVFFPGIINGAGASIGYLTVLFRSITYNSIPKMWIGKGWTMGDQPLFIELSKLGKFKYLPIVTAHYRTLSNSYSHGSFDKEVAFIHAGVNIRKFYAHYYGVDYQDDEFKDSYYVKLMKCAFKHSNKKAANSYREMAIKNKCASLKMWIYYMATLITPLGNIIKFIRKEW